MILYAGDEKVNASVYLNEHEIITGYDCCTDFESDYNYDLTALIGCYKRDLNMKFWTEKDTFEENKPVIQPNIETVNWIETNRLNTVLIQLERIQAKIQFATPQIEEIREINRLLQNLQSAAHALSVFTEDL